MSELAAEQPPQSIDDLEADLLDETALESAPSPSGQAEVPPAPTLITEQEVLFSTAAAVPARPTRWWTKTTRAVDTAMRAIAATSSTESGPRTRHYLPRQAYLESSRMEREMHRL
jgi:hypothetical protein